MLEMLLLAFSPIDFPARSSICGQVINCVRMPEFLLISVLAGEEQRYRFKDEKLLYKMLFTFQFPVQLSSNAVRSPLTISLFFTLCFPLSLLSLSLTRMLGIFVCMTLKFDWCCRKLVRLGCCSVYVPRGHVILVWFAFRFIISLAFCIPHAHFVSMLSYGSQKYTHTNTYTHTHSVRLCLNQNLIRFA